MSKTAQAIGNATNVVIHVYVLEHSRTIRLYVYYVNKNDCKDFRCQYNVIQCIVNVACSFTMVKCAIGVKYVILLSVSTWPTLDS